MIGCLLTELKEIRSRGESGLIICNGAVVARPPRPSNKPTTEGTNHPTQPS